MQCTGIPIFKGYNIPSLEIGKLAPVLWKMFCVLLFQSKLRKTIKIKLVSRYLVWAVSEIYVLQNMQIKDELFTKQSYRVNENAFLDYFYMMFG
jgi:cellulose synthase/poly-beta-1,6-N-acetylglucosamine synthase-like glycosyltransferase